MKRIGPRLALLGVVLVTLVLTACALRPAGESQERAALAEAGKAWEQPVEVPPLPAQPTLDDYLQHAFLANADLQARYWQWRSAVEQVPRASSWPALAVSFSVMFSKQNMSLWNRTTLGIQNEPSSMIPFPTKLATAGKRALEDARAAGESFRQAKFALQGQVRSTYYDIALLAESIRIQQDDVALLKMISQQTAIRVANGSATQADLLSAQTALDLADNQLSNLKARVPGLTAKFNALLGRDAQAPVPLPAALPAPRQLTVSDAELISVGSERSPELAGLAREVAGRQDALSLAKQQYLPDFGLMASLTGNVQRMVGGMLMLPTRLEAIKAGIEQARADLKAVEAARTQYGRDLAASFILNLYVLRNDERQADLFEHTILPRSRQAVQVAQTAYANNQLGFAQLIDTQRTLLDVELTLAQVRMEREKALAAIETWSAVDVETMAPGRAAVRAMGGAMASGGAGGGGTNAMGGM
jgi:cobalt-zinc-cadmium efflux system outer membrane protein